MSEPTKVYVVTWRDAVSHDDDDVGPEEIDSDCIRRTAGFFLKKTKNYVILCTDYDEGEETPYGRVHKIPNGMIVKIEKYQRPL
jgi:hypothetical protein